MDLWCSPAPFTSCMLSGGNRNRRRRMCKKANKGFKQTVKTTRGAEEGGKKRNRWRAPSSPPHAQQTFDLQPNPPDEKGVNAVGCRLRTRWFLGAKTGQRKRWDVRSLIRGAVAQSFFFFFFFVPHRRHCLPK